MSNKSKRGTRRSLSQQRHYGRNPANRPDDAADISDSVPQHDEGRDISGYLDSDERFNNKLGLPANPDFSQLLNIIDDLDDMMIKAGWGVVATATPVDFNSIAYAAKMRADRAMNQLGADTPEIEKLILLWIDAWVAGYIMGHQKTLAETGQDLDGSRRPVVKESDQEL